jgi:hypothetical protein
LDISKRLLDCYGAEGDLFLEKIFTGDEIWIHHYTPDGKGLSMEWKHTHLPTKRKFNSHPTAGQIMLTVFWDHKRYCCNIIKTGVQQ